MRGSTGWGAVVGFACGLALDVMFFGPQFSSGDTYEIEDALLALGLPNLVVATGVGTIAGGLVPRRPAGEEGAAGRTRAGQALAVGVAAVSVVLGVVGFLSATGRL